MSEMKSKSDESYIPLNKEEIQIYIKLKELFYDEVTNPMGSFVRGLESLDDINLKRELCQNKREELCENFLSKANLTQPEWNIWFCRAWHTEEIKK